MKMVSSVTCIPCSQFKNKMAQVKLINTHTTRVNKVLEKKNEAPENFKGNNGS